jgi:hypothetical protein
MHQTPPDLSWMSGSWAGEVWGGRMEEHWTSQDAGTLLGMNRLVREGRTVHKEFMWIESTDKGTSLSVRVFRQPEETVVFHLVESRPQEAVFRNPDHIRLSTISYRKDGKMLMIQLTGERSGENYSEEFRLSPATL